MACNVSVNAWEGVASYSNQTNGQFIAYTDGQTVYNGQNNNVLANGTGLIGSSTSIECALILPKPGGTIGQFYVFHNNTQTHYWSYADMGVGTNGTVITKNNFLQSGGTERCGTVPHGSICPAYWVVISKNTNDSVAAYLVDTGGISTTPVVSSTGITGGNRRGNIVFSEDFTKIGMNVEGKGMYVANFNTITGQATNWTQIGNTTSGFGSAFSPDGTKVYYTNTWSANLYQYDLNSGTQTYLGAGASSYPVLARDGKIYVSRYGQQWLGVVNSPNSAGTASNYVLNGLAIPTGCQCRWGLPNPFHMEIGYHPAFPDTITLCPGEDSVYTTTVPGDSFLWNTGDTTASVLLDTAGLYWVEIGNGDCSSSDSVYLQFADSVSITADTVCLNEATTFAHYTNMPSSFISAYNWDFGDGSGTSSNANPTYSYSSGDTFTVQLEIETTSGCVAEATFEAIVHPLPQPSFDFTDECDGDTVSFDNTSQPAQAAIDAFSWDIDDDGSEDYSSTDITHIYGNHGSYTVELWARDANGCADSVIQVVDVHAIPVADFVAPNQCHHVLHEFFDSSQVAIGNISQWDWTFGDGNGDMSQNPTHTYADPGYKTVTLTVITPYGCTDSETKTTRVFDLPEPDFQVGATCENIDAVFTETSVSPSGNVIAYQWNFGDGATSNIANPSHDYGVPGAFDVTFSVTTNFGCTDTITKPLRIYPAPKTAFAFDNEVCVGEPLPFIDQSVIAQATPGGDSIVSWTWEVNGNFHSSEQFPEYIANKHTSISVKLTTVSNYGCTTFLENVGNVYANPIAKFDIEPGCQHFPTAFTDQSTVETGIISNWYWEFGDGETSLLERPEHVYNGFGDFTVYLHVSSNKGCVDSIEVPFEVRETPKTHFNDEPQQGCTEFLANLTNETSFSNPQLMTYAWYIDSVKVSGQNHANVWLENDLRDTVRYYSVRLIGTAANGCQTEHSAENMIAVLPKPRARFITDDDLFSMWEPDVAFYNMSETGVRWLWEFGDSTKSTDFEPVHTYKKHGLYWIKLTAWNAYSCPDTFVEYIKLDPITTLYVPSAFTPNGDGDNETWSVQGFNEGNPFRVRVWNRWGNLMFESTDMSYGWDGIMPNGKLAPVGVYVYEIVYITSEHATEELSGQFTLLR